MWPIKTIVFFGGFLVACFLSLWYPVIGLVNYMIVYQVLPENHWWAAPLQGLGIRYSLWAAMAMVFGMVVNYQTGRLPPLRPTMNVWEWLAVAMVLLAAGGHYASDTVTPWQSVNLEKFCKMMFFVLCMTHLVTTRQALWTLLWALVIGSLWVGYDAFTAPVDMFARGRLNGIGGPDFRHSSGLGVHMAAMLPLIGTACLLTRQWRWRCLGMLAGALAFNTVVLCRTRSAFIGLLAGVLTAIALVPRSWRWRTYLGFGLAAVGVVVLTDAGFWDRMATLGSPESRSSDAAIQVRYAVWGTALRMIVDYPWGIGIGNFSPWVSGWNPDLGWRAAHNTVLLCAVELGIPALIMFLVQVGISVRCLWVVYHWADRSEDPAGTRMLAYGLLVSLVVYFVGGQFTDRFYTESFWWVLALPVCLHRAVGREVGVQPCGRPRLVLNDDPRMRDWEPACGPA